LYVSNGENTQNFFVCIIYQNKIFSNENLRLSSMKIFEKSFVFS